MQLKYEWCHNILVHIMDMNEKLIDLSLQKC